MNKPTFAALGCLLGFAVGVAVATYHERTSTRPLPQPQLLGELESPGGPQRVALPIRPEDVARLDQRMQEIERSQAAFEREFAALNAAYQQRIAALLTPQQTERFFSSAASSASLTPAVHPTNATPGESENRLVGRRVSLPREQVGPDAASLLPPDALQSILELTFVSWSTENLTSELALAESQQQAIHTLLEERRAKFLELVDRTPPPSLRLLSLASGIRLKAADHLNAQPQPHEISK